MIAIEPNIRAIARANRAFLGRAVRFLAEEAGIRQFLDIGSGIPAAGTSTRSPRRWPRAAISC